MRNRNILAIIIFVIGILLVFVLSLDSTNPKHVNQKSIGRTISYMLETEANTGTYETVSSNEWPKDGYTYNEKLSYCVNGSSLIWDDNIKSVSLTTSKNDICYLYFDIIKEYTSNDTLIALNLSAKEETPDFSIIATTDETADGLYAEKDDYGTSYYFRGAVKNNYVYFAGYYWRIIRINGDGSLRIIYDGTTAHDNGKSSADRKIGLSEFNINHSDNADVGYMYGTPGSSTYEETHANINESTIKTYLDNWYKTNIVDKGYSEAVSDEIFCNDRKLYSGTGIGTKATRYKAYNRLDTNKRPQLSCSQRNDAFTVDDEENGNGKLTYPVGLITADEVMLAGGNTDSNNQSYYLYKGYYIWSLTPYYSGGYSSVFILSNAGRLSDDDVDSTDNVAPVINLSAEYCQTLSGTGTITDPFRVK